jgi:protein-L-isoaspartate(D-aspartate) O-methyltransferase
VHVLHGDGTLGWPEHAPYDAIIVAAGGPEVPKSLKQQLKIGGRLVIPVGRDTRAQELIRVTRQSENDYKTEDIADVRFVPLLGEEGWPSQDGQRRDRSVEVDASLVDAIARYRAFSAIDSADLGRSCGEECARRAHRRARTAVVLPHAPGDFPR